MHQLDDFSYLLVSDLFKSCKAFVVIVGWNYGLRLSKLCCFETCFRFFFFSFKVGIVGVHFCISLCTFCGTPKRRKPRR